MARTEDKHGDGCRLQTLARGRTAHIQHCASCSALSLHLGPLTVRFDESALESLWSTLGEALLALHRKHDAESSEMQTARTALRGQA